MRFPRSTLLLAAAVVVGCVPAGQLESPLSSPAPPAGSTADPSPEPSLRLDLPLPSGMVLPPILDPDGAGPPYSRGDEVEVAGMTVVYEGTAAAEDGYIAVFAVSGPMPAQPSALFFLPEGPSVQLMADGGEVVSAPFHLRGMPASDTLFAWRIGTETIVWELGPIDGP